MDKETFEYVAERVDILSVSPASRQDTKEAALAWKEAVAADPQAADAATEKLLDYVETRMLPIDDLIEFLKGPAAGIFGAEKAAEMLKKQLERKANGEKWCDCEAHVAEAQLLTKFGRIEA